MKYHLLVQFDDVYDASLQEEKGKFAGATGDIDSSSIELDSASPERARAWLSASCPELIEEVDFRALNGYGDEADALLSLRDLDFNRYTDLNDLFTRNCLTVYLQSIIEVDTSAPYSAQLSGYVRKAEGLDTLYHLTADATLIYINNIGMQPSYNLDESDTGWSLSAFISVLGVTRTDEAQQYIIPVETLQDLRSIRTAYYTENS